MKMQQLLDNFLLFQKVKGNTLETILYYNKRIGYFIKFCNNKNIKLLNIKDYNNYALYLKQKNLSSYTIKTSLNAVKIFLKYAYDYNYITNNITKNIKPYKCEKKTIVVLNDIQINEILNSYDYNTLYGSRNLLIISLILDAGLRVSEVSNLDFEDINIGLKLIKVYGKGQKERLVPLTDTILFYFNKYIEISKLSNGALFIDFKNNLRLKSSSIAEIIIRLKRKLGYKKLNPHYLRHTFATLFLVNGGDPVHLQLILGHETLFMTEHYLHIANQMTMQKQSKFSPLSNLKKT